MEESNLMNDSVLDSVKLNLGIPIEYNHFDQQILLHLNSVLAVLPQLGIGSQEGFFVQDSSFTWGEILGDMAKPYLYMYVKTYVCLRVRLLFDPPTSSGAIDAIERQLREFEWRITVTTDPPNREEVNVNV